MSSKVESIDENFTVWQKFSHWLRVFDASLDLDPVEYSLYQANRKVAALETRMAELESQLAPKGIDAF